MAESDDIQAVVAALKAVPEKKLRLIELANRIPIKHGDFDPTALSELATEINLARVEAGAYGGATLQAVDALSRLQDKEHEVLLRPATEEDLVLDGGYDVGFIQM